MKHILRSVLLLLLVMAPLKIAFGAVFVSVNFAPPALPVYDQPVCPGDGYIWLPGYWAWDVDDYDYYWVPGYWMTAPEVGYLWTPAWWGWDNGAFVFHEGYWGPEVGFYGGVNYGFGYFGDGFAGGRWDNGHFFYNAAVLNVGGDVHNTYRDTTIINKTTIVNNHVSYNGGEGGITARPTAQQETYGRQQHMAPVAQQTQHMQTARSNPQMRASVNQGRPAIAATQRPGSFSGQGVVAAKAAGGEYHAPPAKAQGGARPGAPATARPETPEAGKAPGTAHPGEAPSTAHPETPEANRPTVPTRPGAQLQQTEPSGNAKRDEENQKQQQKMTEQQNKENQQLEKQQTKENQQLEKQQQQSQKPNSNVDRQQQAEQQRQQQMEKQRQQQPEPQQRQEPAARPQAPEQQQQPEKPQQPDKEKDKDR